MDDLIARAQNYVAASNAHDIERIRPMLAADCSYRSDGVGRHDGADAIISMMQSFFAANPDVHWSTGDYQRQASRVSFDFRITLGTATYSGHEEIHFSEQGKICRIVVHR